MNSSSNYTQTLSEIFNIFRMHLPVNPMQRTEFISFFAFTSGLFDLRMVTGQVIASVEVHEFEPPIIKPNPNFAFDLEPIKKAFDNFFEIQKKARHIYSQFEIDEFNKKNQSTFDPNNLFGSSKQHKPSSEISLKDVIPELNIDYTNVRQSSNIPNIGRASL